MNNSAHTSSAINVSRYSDSCT